jgi:predicted small lipoprotein YifL
MKRLLALTALTLLAACGSGGPPPPDWKTDAADLIERYAKHALRGENTLAERYFQQAVAATGGAGRVAETGRLWLARCAVRRAMLIDDGCAEYTDLATVETTPADRAYFRFVTLDWNGLDPALLPTQHRELAAASPDRRRDVPARVADPLARLLEASLLVMRREADADTLALAVDTASAQGWRQPLLTYLKLQQAQAEAAAQTDAAARLTRRIQLIEASFSAP